MCVYVCVLGCMHAVEAARKFNANAVDCSSVLSITCPCWFCLFVFL